ncbi:MAG: hypothetical protein WCF24_11795 [Acidimicrobiales bacterium]
MTERSDNAGEARDPTRRSHYSIWPGESGIDAWDVERLIALSVDLPVEEVEVAKIGAIDIDYWFDSSGDEPAVRGVVEHAHRISDVDLAYPIILGSDGRVMDGMHRVAKAILEGHTTIKAVRFHKDPDPDYRNCKPDELPTSRASSEHAGFRKPTGRAM